MRVSMQTSRIQLKVHSNTDENVIIRVMQLNKILANLQQIEPKLKELTIASKKAPALYPELFKVLEIHTRSNDYMVQFVKTPLLIDLSN